MKTMILATAAAMTLATGVAYAGEGEGIIANTQFTQIPGVIDQAAPQNAPSVATAQNGQKVQVYVTRSNSGTWLFTPNQNAGSNS